LQPIRLALEEQDVKGEYSRGQAGRAAATESRVGLQIPSKGRGRLYRAKDATLGPRSRV